jgi:hypothetical protein
MEHIQQSGQRLQWIPVCYFASARPRSISSKVDSDCSEFLSATSLLQGHGAYPAKWTATAVNSCLLLRYRKAMKQHIWKFLRLLFPGLGADPNVSVKHIVSVLCTENSVSHRLKCVVGRTYKKSRIVSRKRVRWSYRKESRHSMCVQCHSSMMSTAQYFDMPTRGVAHSLSDVYWLHFA